jgi:signal transduction histidine kinase
MLDTTPAEFDSSPSKSFFVLPDAAKLEALAEFAAGAGHEINNPLATIIGRAQLLLKDEQDPQRRQMLLSIGAQAYRIRDMIGDTMVFGRPPCPELQNVNLAEIVEQLLSRQAGDLANERTTIRVQIPDNTILRADATQLAIVLSELLRNSRQAMSPKGGEIQIVATQLPERPQNIVIDIIDQGKGFTQIEREHAFDPFFSGRQAGRGLGFGLSKCWRIIDQHAGRIEIQSSPTGPTTVRITWPTAA